MPIPAGITVALVHMDAPLSFIGEPGRVHITITPSVPLIWEATGTPIINFFDVVQPANGQPFEVYLPHTDQDGFLDGNGNTFEGWYYTVKITYEKGGQRLTFPDRDFQILTGQDDVDLALVPAGTAYVPSVAPILPVTSIDGQTGAVTLAELGLDPTSLGNAYVGQGQVLMDLRKQAGVVGDGVANDAAAIQTALNSAAALGLRVFARGTFKISSTVQISSAVDLSGATFNYTGAGVAVRVGVTAGFISRQDVRLPHIIHTAKTVNGWAQVAGSVGVEISNLYTGAVHVPRVNNFETGLKLNGLGQGVSYVNIHLGHLDNNKVNMQFSADATGWCNQNTILGGRMSHNSNEGVAVAGTRHVLMDLTPSKVNNNNFFGTSLESPNTVEYHLDCAGSDNYFWGCRWENTGTGARIIWRADSIGNVVDNGFGVHTVVETKEAGTANNVRTRGTSRMVGISANATKPVLELENSFSASAPALRVFSAGAESTGADKTTQWAVEMGVQGLKGKRPTDTNDRILADFVNGRLYVGAGTSASTRYFGNVGTEMGFSGSHVCYVTDNTYDFGLAGLRPRYIRAGTAVQTGSFTTATRPSAATAGVGAVIWDSTIGGPVWSDGAAWSAAPIITSANGTRFRIGVDNDGILTTTSL